MKEKSTQVLWNSKVVKISPWVKILRKLHFWSPNFGKLAILVPGCKFLEIVKNGLLVNHFGKYGPWVKVFKSYNSSPQSLEFDGFSPSAFLNGKFINQGPWEFQMWQFQPLDISLENGKNQPSFSVNYMIGPCVILCTNQTDH